MLRRKPCLKACAELQTCFCLSTYSNYSIEQVAEATRQNNPLNWFQLYVERDRSITENLVRKCEQQGFKAIVLTVDRQKLGRRLGDLRLGGFQVPDHLPLGNFKGGISTFGNDIDPTLDWSAIAWLKQITHLPLVVKGVLRGDDAVRAAEAGADAIWVSNHGARQLDTCPAPVCRRGRGK